MVGRGDRQKHVTCQTIRPPEVNLLLLPNTFAICRLPGDVSIPTWATGDFISITRNADELSIVCPQDQVPGYVKTEREWRCLRVAGTLDFAEVGVLSALAGPLAGAGISIFVVSTFDTDYLMVRETDLERAVVVLGETGHGVEAL